MRAVAVVLAVLGIAVALLRPLGLGSPGGAAGGFLLSIAAAMGVVVWIFQDGNLADLFGPRSG